MNPTRASGPICRTANVPGSRLPLTRPNRSRRFTRAWQPGSKAAASAQMANPTRARRSRTATSRPTMWTCPRWRPTSSGATARSSRRPRWPQRRGRWWTFTPRGSASRAESVEPDLLAQRLAEPVQFLALVGARRRHAPDRLRPGRIAAEPGDDVDVELRHDIAERRDVELVAIGHGAQRACDARHLGHQLRLRDVVEIDQFDDVGPARNQQQPGVVRIVDDEHARQRQIADAGGVAFELRVQRPGLGHELRPENQY